MEIVKTSVQKVMEAMKTSITALFPILKETHLVDDNLEGYDGWDLITESLFTALIEDSIKWSLPKEQVDKFNLPKYGFDLSDVKEKSFIQVVSNAPSETKKIFCFIAFRSSPKFPSTPALIMVKEVLPDESLSEYRIISCEDVHYTCSHFASGKRTKLDQLLIEN